MRKIEKKVRVLNYSLAKCPEVNPCFERRLGEFCHSADKTMFTTKIKNFLKAINITLKNIKMLEVKVYIVRLKRRVSLIAFKRRFFEVTRL